MFGPKLRGPTKDSPKSPRSLPPISTNHVHVQIPRDRPVSSAKIPSARSTQPPPAATADYGKRVDKRCRSVPMQLLHSKEGKPTSISYYERRIITQKLHEIDNLRKKIIELQEALTSHEEMITQPKASMEAAAVVERKRSGCFSYLNKCCRSQSADRIQRLDSRMTMDQMSTEAVFDSSRDSLPQGCASKKSHRNKEKNRIVIDYVHDLPEEKRKARADAKPGGKQATAKTPSKITNHNMILLPELYSSNKSSTEEIFNLAEKLEMQNNEIKQIKISLQECLDLLRNKQAQEEARAKATNIVQQKVISKSMMDDYIYMNRVTPSILTNYMKEREILHLLGPNSAQVFRCSATCEYSSSNVQSARSNKSVHSKKSSKCCASTKKPSKKKKKKCCKKRCSACASKPSRRTHSDDMCLPCERKLERHSSTHSSGAERPQRSRSNTPCKMPACTSTSHTACYEKERHSNSERPSCICRRNPPPKNRSRKKSSESSYQKCAKAHPNTHCDYCRHHRPSRHSSERCLDHDHDSEYMLPKETSTKQHAERDHRSQHERDHRSQHERERDQCSKPPKRRKNYFMRCLMCLFCRENY